MPWPGLDKNLHQASIHIVRDGVFTRPYKLHFSFALPRGSNCSKSLTKLIKDLVLLSHENK